MESVVYENLKVLWDYMHLDMPVRPGGCVIGFGCINDDVALRCAQLYRDGFAPKVLFTGGLGRNTSARWSQSEAERFRDIAMARGVPEEAILLENRSTNSAENILFTRERLEDAGLARQLLICVHKPFMERRLYAAMQVYWPQASAIFTSPRLSLAEYVRNTVAQGLSEKQAIDILVGDFQRMDVYAQKGYQIPQDIPEEARRAFHRLIGLGYTGELVQP